MSSRETRSGFRSLSTAFLPLVVLGILSGCASGNFYWGPPLSKCSASGSAAKFGSGACRSGAENYVAWKKSRHMADASLEPAD
jgi:hypothetical protein